MRTSTLIILSLGTLFAFTGCDLDDETDDARLDPDEAVAFRCGGTGCTQSPHVGTFNISNLSEDTTAVTSPDGTTSVQWTGLTKNGLPYAQLRVTDGARCEVSPTTAALGWQSCVGTVIDLSIAQGGQVTTAKMEIQDEMIDSSGALPVYKYRIKANLDPLTGQTSPKFQYDICPAGGEDGTRRVVMLPDVQATWVVTNFDDGLAELIPSTSARFTLACDGYAEAKGYTRGKVLPNTGGARNYGVADYNGFTHAMRALFRKQGTTSEYSALTEHGTPVRLKDLKNDPPLFDELDQTPPIIGFGVYLLESVYNGDVAVQSGRKGATCKKPYVDFPCSGNGEIEYPDGVHRRPEYSPPMTVIPGWSDLPDCDTIHLNAFGAVGVYGWYQGQCLPPE
ncbi:hypothetical protein SAMN02745121_05282 [Nannocystis exedens]|uniref:Lipoprotein n=1 Tax=Nannocystis exedens TaxID=54 RepID=A0A1I2CVE2_9BACT|nr:hypothetical protein [Nannocystis exedens]PCC68608.1 hypothetical protein NAEX_01624 [Nannocystis exedens]SFE72281.1 hypothetical protein SAMN02745121_05282 [Nannocystis exedens]